MKLTSPAHPLWSLAILIGCDVVFCLAGAFFSLGAIPLGLAIVFWLQAIMIAGLVVISDAVEDSKVDSQGTAVPNQDDSTDLADFLSASYRGIKTDS